MNRTKVEVAFWGCVVSANVWNAAGHIGPAFFWLVFALVIALAQHFDGRAKEAA